MDIVKIINLRSVILQRIIRWKYCKSDVKYWK